MSEFERDLRPMLEERFRFADATEIDAVVLDPFTDRVPFRGFVFPCVPTLGGPAYARLLAVVAAGGNRGFYASSTLRWPDETNDCYVEVTDSHALFLRTLGRQWEQVFYAPDGSWLLWFSNDESVLLAAEQPEVLEQLQGVFWPLRESALDYLEYLKAAGARGDLGSDWRALATAVLTPIIGNAVKDLIATA